MEEASGHGVTRRRTEGGALAVGRRRGRGEGLEIFVD